MARLYGSVLGLMVGALTALSPVTYATAGTGDDVRSWGKSYDIVISYASAYDEPMFALPVLENQRYAAQRDYPTFKPHADKQRLQLAAVRPSAVSGWRSGRVRALAFG